MTSVIASVARDEGKRGGLLRRLYAEARMTIDAYRTVYEQSIEFGSRKLTQAAMTKGSLADDIEALEAKIAELRTLVAPADAVFLDAKIESELQELDDESAAELLESIGQHERGLDSLARAGFHTLKLQTYLTAGPKEARAWVIHQGDTAPKAAGVIHTDFEKGFIKAEVVSYEDLTTAGSMAAAKAAGKVRIEGKDYVMNDGDVVEFRFNV
jgi:ribosome-binding ATPase YchF (GTP1/OBG family)